MTTLIKYNPIMMTDSYKYSHIFQYPNRKGFVSSYIESRGGEFDATVFYGLQILLKDLEANPITHEMVDEAKELITEHGEPFDEEGWRLIVDRHGGKLPLRIQAVPEGQVVPTKNILVQVINTDEDFPWLPSFMETVILRAVWYPTTVATLSYEVKKIIKNNLDETANIEGLMFKLHDFGARGASSEETAAIGGSAHLVNFMGTDTATALRVPRAYYGEKGAVGFSIPAAEHSTATSWGKDREVEFARHMLNAFNTPVIAVVSDSYDIFNMVENVWCGELLDEVKASGKTIVIRPDSGEPVETLRKIFRILERCLGDEVTLNEQGYKILPSYYRVIQGDGININSIRAILNMLKEEGWTGDNIAFGMGGKLLQGVDRDTQKFAMKASAGKYGDDDWIDIFKSPITDKGKVSKKGRMALIYDGEDQLITVPEKNTNDDSNLLKDVFIDGIVTKEYTFTEVRERAARGW